jgi:flagellar FliL protein
LSKASGEDEGEQDVLSEPEGTAGDGDADAPKKRKALIIIGSALVLVLGGAAFLHYSGLLASLRAPTSPDYIPAALPISSPHESTYYDLPDVLVSLTNVSTRSMVLKLRVTLELSSFQDTPNIDRAVPRIMNEFHIYLRELRLEDLKGTSGMERLRRELLVRALAAGAPARVSDLLIQEMLVK